MDSITLPNSIANLVKPTRYLTCAETAKLVRQALKEAFPEVKFSVKSHTYSMGASINVSWTDGPSHDQVDAIAGAFEGAEFDGMTDYKSSRTHVMDGEPVSFGADYIHCYRRVSDAKIDALTAILEKAGEQSWCELFRRFGFSADKSIDIISGAYNKEPKIVAERFLSALPTPEFEGRSSKLAETVNMIDKH